MSRNVELPDDVYARVEEHAAEAGMTVVEWIAAGAPPLCRGDGVTASVNGTPQSDVDDSTAPVCKDVTPPPRTLADEFAGRVGLVTLPETATSERTGELFAEGVLEKHRRNQL
jgi:hypothetical protein